MFPVLVHNQCSDFELVSPAYFGYHVIWLRSPDQKVDANTVIRSSFGNDVAKDKFSCALLYKLQRKMGPKSNDQSNADNISTEGTSTSLQLLVIWKYNVKYKNRFFTRALLISHGNTIIWDEDTLKKLHYMYFALLRDDYNIKDTWLLDDETVLMTTLKWKKDSCTFKITISEGTREDDSMEPLRVLSSIEV
jgi:hypothetical protein